MEVGELHLGTGTTSTDFHKEGKWPSLREQRYVGPTKVCGVICGPPCVSASVDR